MAYEKHGAESQKPSQSARRPGHADQRFRRIDTRRRRRMHRGTRAKRRFAVESAIGPDMGQACPMAPQAGCRSGQRDRPAARVLKDRVCRGFSADGDGSIAGVRSAPAFIIG
ncbi:hypothetical protein [Ralstonia syzygii]|uniref:hypothetical protein n=1 Tax=Ralstonia syzygii TaxID=28097 RepID=UPI0018D03B7A|nr:hypothetical protein [Ralstonia syzygii]